MSTTSLHFLSCTPKTLTTKPSSTTCNAVSLFPSFSLINKHVPKLFTTPLSVKLFKISAPSRLKVAVSSDFGVAEETLSSDLEEDSGEDEERSFSPDLKIFVGNLPFSCDSAGLAELFEQAGNVQMVEVIYDKVTGRSRGFGFVTMSTVQEVETAVQQFNGYELEGRALRVNSGPPPPREDSPFRASRGGGGGGGRSFDNANRLYVGNLAWGVDDGALETLFSEQGKVVDAKVVYDRESGRSRGFGFVTYSTADEVNRAIDALNGADLDGRQIRVSVAEAPPSRRQY